MKLHIIGSSSAGNGYIIESDTEALILETGCKFVEYKKALKFNISKIVGCFSSHVHGDHAKYMSEFVQSGIDTYALQEVLEEKGLLNAGFTHPIKPNAAYRVGSFIVQTFKAIHDVPCVGFVVRHEKLGKLLFVTDSGYVGYKFKGLSHIMVEANYADDILESNMEKGYVPVGMRERLYVTHFEFENTKRFLKNQDLSEVSNIVLIHLSGGNSNEKRFVSEVQELTGIPTVAARPGVVIDISKTPY